MKAGKLRLWIARLGLVAPLLASTALSAGATDGAPSQSPPAKIGLPSEHELARIPIGDFAGGAESNIASLIKNDHASTADVKAGRKLYVDLNCADCHGFNAKGNMGPNLTDKSWRFGGTPAEIYKSIFEGRSTGMPAWGAALPPKAIWQLVAYIQSLGGTFPRQFYQAQLQGDKLREHVAPEINFEQSLAGSPPYRGKTVAAKIIAQGKAGAPGGSTKSQAAQGSSSGVAGTHEQR